MNELQDVQDMRCGALHVNWEISQLPLASPLWSTLSRFLSQFWLHYTGWIDVLVCVCRCFKNQDSLSISVSGLTCELLFWVFSSGELFEFNVSLELSRPEGQRLAQDLGTRHLVDARTARAR